MVVLRFIGCLTLHILEDVYPVALLGYYGLFGMFFWGC